MEAVGLAVDYVIEDIYGRRRQAKAEKGCDRPANRRRDGKLLAENQSGKNEYVLYPVSQTHNLHEFHAFAFLNPLGRRRACSPGSNRNTIIEHDHIIENIDIRVGNA